MSPREWVPALILWALVVGVVLLSWLAQRIARRWADGDLSLGLPDPTDDEPTWATEPCGEYPRVLSDVEERQIADLRDGLVDGGQFEEPTPTMREQSIHMGQIQLGRRGEPTS